MTLLELVVVGFAVVGISSIAGNANANEYIDWKMDTTDERVEGRQWPTESGCLESRARLVKYSHPSWKHVECVRTPSNEVGKDVRKAVKWLKDLTD